MWATDATQIPTVQDGRVWLFGVIEHWNAELLGWNVSKRGIRFDAAQAVSRAVCHQFGHLSAGAARGLALRHDHGSNFMAEHFQKQVRFCGISPSYAFVGEPETNGVIDRFFRTFKEQIVHGRIYQTIDEVRSAVCTFVARYNAEWLIEKNGLRSSMRRARRMEPAHAQGSRLTRDRGSRSRSAPAPDWAADGAATPVSVPRPSPGRSPRTRAIPAPAWRRA
jgi:transposase InsO family protein